MDVFVSCASDSRQWLERLKSSLAGHNIRVWYDMDELAAGQDWSDRIEQALKKSEAVIVLVDSNTVADDRQRRTWQLALEAVWTDSSKRLIPFLLHEAEPPAFTRATISADETLPVVRAVDPSKDWDQAIRNLVALLHKNADLSQIEQVPAITERDREKHRLRQAQLIEYVERLKSSMDLPQNPAEWKARRSQQR